MAGKKKWAKGRVREKITNLVVLDPKTAEKVLKDIPKVRCVRELNGAGGQRVQSSRAGEARRLLFFHFPAC
jgi:ribosomal protein S25